MFAFLFSGKWLIKDVKPNSLGESQKIKVKVRVNIHGIVTVSSATIVTEKKPADDEQDCQEPNESMNVENTQDQPMDNSGEQENGMEDQSNEVSNPATPEQQQSWTQRVGQWFSSVRPFVAC